jgi:Uma2 family endonuclease
MAATLVLADHCITMQNISWATYENLLREAKGEHLRLAYDDGDLEFMTFSFGHENIAETIGLFIRAVALAMNIPIRGGGSTTLKRKLKRKGLEPDKCYWIKNERAMRGQTKWVAKRHPPPDLAVEVDISHSVINRMEIYGSLGVPEVWRYKGKKLRVYLLGDDGRYQESASSPTFPHLDMDKFNEFVQAAATMDETALLREFSEWVRKEILPLAEVRKNGKRSKDDN